MAGTMGAMSEHGACMEICLHVFVKKAPTEPSFNLTSYNIIYVCLWLSSFAECRGMRCHNALNNKLSYIKTTTGLILLFYFSLTQKELFVSFVWGWSLDV